MWHENIIVVASDILHNYLFQRATVTIVNLQVDGIFGTNRLYEGIVDYFLVVAKLTEHYKNSLFLVPPGTCNIESFSSDAGDHSSFL